MNYYPDSFEHLRDELKRLTILLHRAVLLNRAQYTHTIPGSLAGQVVEAAEIDALLQNDDFLAARWQAPQVDPVLASRVETLDADAARLRNIIDEKVTASTKKGIRLPLVRLIEEFGLSAFELEVLLLAIAPDLDPAFEKVFAELHDDVIRTRPSVDLALQVLCRNEREKIKARSYLSPGSHLLLYRFVTFPEDRQSTLLRRVLIPDESVVRFVLGQAPGVLSSGCILSSSTANPAAVAVSTRQLVDRFTDAVTRHDPNHFTLVLQGKPASTLAAAVCAAHSLGRPLLFLDASAEPPSESSILIASRDAALWDAVLTVRMPNVDSQHHDDERGARSVFWPAALAFSRQPSILLSQAGQLPPIPSSAVIWSIPVEQPGYLERIDLWNTSSNALTEADTHFLADSFPFSEDQIRMAQRMAYGSASLRNPSDPRINADDLFDASRQVASPQLNRFAIPVTPRYTWNDLVLPQARLSQLRAIASRIKSRSKVLRDWGFGAKHTRGNGLNVLFTGASGTGKTMAAEVLANDLSLNLFQVDLSNVVSKYIGETEKHLSAIFDEAELSNALLFFDEADALFGKRTELKDAHDRYANIEVNYLLQRIERYEGLVILSTNFQKNMDDAFLRRLHEIVDFPYPSEVSRAIIWQRQLPSKAPKDSNIDFDFLSRRFKLSGGNISNAVRSAAYLAAAEDSPIRMSHLVRAVREEYQKLGRLILQHDFEPYFASLQESQSLEEEIPA